MTTITAAQVKELRERTGAGMMECKVALQASNGDMELAIEELRKSGKAKADKKAGRTAAEGMVAVFEKDNRAVMLEVNSETDFVARDNNFTSFVQALGNALLETEVSDLNQLHAIKLTDSQKSVEETRSDLVAKVGENVQIRRFAYSNPETVCVGTYVHGSRIGVIVELDSDNKALARDIAMHIAASKPMVISGENVPAEIVEKEKEIYMAQAASSGKPQDIIEKMVLGRLQKYLDEVSLLGQQFVKEPDITVGGLLVKNKAKVIHFTRFEVGEGIEKTTEDFKEAVMTQMQGK